jgi:hypothetical protein
VSVDQFGSTRAVLATAGYSVARDRTARVRLVFTRAGRSEVQLERSAFFQVVAASRTGRAVVTTRRSIRLNAPAGGFAADRVPERPGRCLPPKAQTLARSLQTRLYRLRGREGLIHVYGCHDAVGRGFALEDFDDLDNGHHFTEPHALAGPYVAFVDNYVYEYAAEPGENYNEVRVVDLRTGRTVREACTDPDCFEPADDLAVAPSGAVAWIAARRVWRLSGRRKKPQRLGGGRGLDVDSLKLRGGRLTWVQDGRTHSAALR